MRLAPHGEDFHCICRGTEAVRLYRGEEELALVINHHGVSVRCSLWSTSDAILEDGEAWARWFDARGMPGPRQERADAAKRAEQSSRSYARWLDAMPPVLRPLWEARAEPSQDQQRALLSEAIPDRRERLQALFSWFGSGEGPWSGFPSYEEAAERLLLEYGTAELVDAAQAEALTDAQLEGAARLFGGWSFGQQRKRDRGQLPLALKARLLAHCLKSSIEDVRRRASRAFRRA
jgi:hypothetical protein